MASAVSLKLLAIFLVVTLGWVAGRLRWLGDQDPARTLSNAAFYLFVPALLFRTTARVEFATLPWGTLAAFFVPAALLLAAVYAWQRRANRRGRLAAAAPAVRAISATFGNKANAAIAGTVPVYQPHWTDGATQWRCTAADGTTVDAKYLPSVCR